MIETVAIIGTGLIGASFGLALKKAGFGGRILGVSSPQAIEDALARGAIDRAAPLEEAAGQADLVYLSQTISRILATLPELARSIRPGALVTDAGSTKAKIVKRAACLRGRAQFLGAHPMAGKETRGAAAADADLFAGRTYLLTPEAAAELETPAAREFIEWLGKTGALPVILSPAEHDRVVALTSHLPQLLSTSLAAVLAERLTRPEHLRAGGPGLADMTRLAGSSWEIWEDILCTNRDAIGAALDECAERLRAMRADLTGEVTRKTFESAADFSARLRR
ncbi:MAG TPA: prephenate dehydrogenase [Bryobacteraceae bacterium]